LQHLTPQLELPFFKWWLDIRKQVHKLQRKGFDSLALLVVCSFGGGGIGVFIKESRFSLWL
jgi:hypothetical protein